MKPQPRIEFGSYRAFGHDGAGGALGFADPMYDMSLGCIPMPMQFPGGSTTSASSSPRLPAIAYVSCRYDCHELSVLLIELSLRGESLDLARSGLRQALVCFAQSLALGRPAGSMSGGAPRSR